MPPQAAPASCPSRSHPAKIGGEGGGGREKEIVKEGREVTSPQSTLAGWRMDGAIAARGQHAHRDMSMTQLSIAASVSELAAIACSKIAGLADVARRRVWRGMGTAVSRAQ